MHNDVVCEHCDSENVVATKAYGVYECLDCGEWFDDPEPIVLEELFERRARKQRDDDPDW